MATTLRLNYLVLQRLDLVGSAQRRRVEAFGMKQVVRGDWIGMTGWPPDDPTWGELWGWCGKSHELGEIDRQPFSVPFLWLFMLYFCLNLVLYCHPHSSIHRASLSSFFQNHLEYHLQESSSVRFPLAPRGRRFLPPCVWWIMVSLVLVVYTTILPHFPIVG